MMLGKMKLEGTMYRGAEPTLEGQLTPELLARAVNALPEAHISRRTKAAALRPGARRRGLHRHQGRRLRRARRRLVIRNGNSFEPTGLSAPPPRACAA
jgi:hypothetical protein